MNSQQMWLTQRKNIPNERINKIATTYDNDGDIDQRQANIMTTDFDKWYKESAQFDFGMAVFGRGLNFTLPDDFYDDLPNDFYDLMTY